MSSSPKTHKRGWALSSFLKGYALHLALLACLVLLVLFGWYQAQGNVVPRLPPVPYEEPFAQEGFVIQGLEAPSMHRGIAIVLDDIGYDLSAVRRVIALPFPVAVSILPDAPFAREAAEMAHRAGKVVMLHLPMEPSTPKYRDRMNDTFLRKEMSETELRQKVEAMLAHIPYVAGINNHMGSRLTELHRPMRWLMQLCREHGLFFIDSRTSVQSVAAEEARKAGIAWAERKVFLDHDATMESIRLAWRAARRWASKHESCIVIAHPYPESLRFLESLALGESATDMVAVTRLLHQGA